MGDFKFYEVGGKVRDELLGLKSKDVDYVAVPNENILERYKFGISNITNNAELKRRATSMIFNDLEEYLRKENFEIFLITPECYTIRARFPEGYKYQGVADFVMARKEVGYIPDTRTPIVVPGNLYDDLSRRDFTVNAMAKDPDTGEIIDYFTGKNDIGDALIRTPLDPVVTFDDDPLRILRAIRFAVTKRFTIASTTWDAMTNYDYYNKMPVVSEERIREELAKCFKCNTIRTLDYLNSLPMLRDYIFKFTKLWLKPTNES